MTSTLLHRSSVDEAEHATTPALHVMFLLGGLGIGGAERQAIALAGALQQLGVRITIVATADGPLRDDIERRGLSVHVVRRPLGFAPATIPALRRVVASLRPDVIYAFLEVQWLLAAGAASKSGAPHGVNAPSSPVAQPAIVFGLRTGAYDRPEAGMRARIVHALLPATARHADLLVANSASGLESFRHVARSSMPGCVIANGIDTDKFAPDRTNGTRFRKDLGIPADAFVVGHVGRLDPVKNHELLITAFARFANSEAGAQLVCVGAGSAERRDTLLGVANDAGVRDRVHFTGARHDLSAVYSAFDVLALPSRLEGFPNVVAEAMACGVPAAVTAVGASADIVGPFGEVSATHEASDFAAALSRLARRAGPDLSAACRARVLEHYTLARCAQHTLDMLQSIHSRQIS